ncbi:flavodoxin family protein [Candidatus Methanoplasma termitum]|nr:flavodoxin family protein [Candidatus Methanoplasma termitum]MCL2333288.1 flavodoxin family protein [Candidatus Methanoplasma sp.]
MSKILAVNASPRRGGNCETIVNAITDGAMRFTSNMLDIVNLNTLRLMNGCQACMGCKFTGSCVAKDDLTPILSLVKESDSIIVATPVYFGHASAQYKVFEDRLFSFIEKDGSGVLPSGKKLVTIVTCEDDVEIAETVADEIEWMFVNYFSFNAVGRIVLAAKGSKNAAKKNDELMEKAILLGKEL